jgi:type IV pilus assembly protein PilM
LTFQADFSILEYMADSSFCIDIGEKYTRVVDLNYGNGKINLTSIGSEPTIGNFFTDDTEKSIENQSEIISKLVSDLKISKKNAHVVIPDAMSFFQILEFAKLNEKELLSAVRYQSDQFIPMAIDEVVFDIEIIKEDKERKKNTILIVASPKKMVDRVEKVIEMAGLAPESLENELSAFCRLFTEVLKPQGQGAYLIINMGFSSTSIYLIDATTSLVLLTRTVKIGFDLFIKELRFNFELQETKAIEVLRTMGFEKNTSYDIATIAAPLMKELLNEISKFVMHSREKYALPVSKIYVFNHNNNVLSFEKKLAEVIGIPTESMLLREYLVNNPISQSFSNEMTSYVSAIAGCIR